MKLWTNADFEAMFLKLKSEDQRLRHNIRYACFRIQNEKNGGAKAGKEHYKIGKKIEKLEGFGGWYDFAIKWDVSSPNPIQLVQRKWSIHQEWNQLMERIAEPLVILEGEKVGPKSDV